MFIVSIVAMIIGIVLIILSHVIYHSKAKDVKEKMFIPGVCLLLIGAFCLIGYFVNASV